MLYKLSSQYKSAQMGEKIAIGCITMWGTWCLYGGVRGWNFYNIVHENKLKEFEKDHKRYPTIYTKDKQPTYFYLTRSMYGMRGILHYACPPFSIFAFINEAYRAEAYFRNLNDHKNNLSYIDPFYPISHFTIVNPDE